MTNEELDHWLAEKVMGWTHQDIPVYKVPCGVWKGSESDDRGAYNFRVNAPGNNYYECQECDWWHPTTNIAQAIEAAEKARTKGRIGDWVLLSPAGNTISRPMAEIALDGGFFFSRDADAYSLALCRAIHEALRDRP